MMTPMEKDIEKALRCMVSKLGGLCLKWVCPGWAGVPDRIVLLPGGHIVFVELKRSSGGRVAPLQKWWKEQLQKLGFTHLYVLNQKDIADLRQILLVWLMEDKAI